MKINTSSAKILFLIVIFLEACLNTKTENNTTDTINSNESILDNEIDDYSSKIDSLIKTDSIRPFNGIILISKEDEIKYLKKFGYSNFETKDSIKKDHQFVIGSLSKQITAVLILLELEKGNLELNDPIKKYLPEIKQTWANKVTVHQLLNHTHGIVGLYEPLKFIPGSDFSYSNLGYGLLGRILERVSNKTFAELNTELFAKIGMKNSVNPDISDKEKLISGYRRHKNGELLIERNTFSYYNVPAALIMSTIQDLNLWNKALHTGNLISDENYKSMINPTAKQNHALFGEVGYGYALRISQNKNIFEIGHTGYVPAYISMNFFYPEQNISEFSLKTKNPCKNRKKGLIEKNVLFTIR